MSRKDTEIARLRRELAREQAAHEETRKMLADLIAKQPAPPFPLVPWQPQPWPAPFPDPLNPYGPGVLPWPFTITTTSDHITVGDPPSTPFPGTTFIPADGFTVTSH